MSEGLRFAFVVGMVAAFLWAFPATLVAQEESPATTEAESPVLISDQVPAVQIQDAEPVDEGASVPYVYLAPTALVIGAGVVLITIVMYFVRVTRARYRVEQ